MMTNFEKKASQTVNQDTFSQSLSEDQFSQVLSAIIDGKYSWACTLLLRFTGHDPRNYLPYRTYIRLVKERCQRSETTKKLQSPSDSPVSPTKAKRNRRKIMDLNHLEPLDDIDISSGILGGSQGFQHWENSVSGDTVELDSVMGIPVLS